MRKFITKSIGALAAVAAILGVGFVGGLSSAPQVSVPANVAYEASPSPYGSGVLGDWSNLSHGLYCFQAGTTTVTKVTYNTIAKRTTYAATSASFSCPGEDIRLYGDSITFGGKSAFAAEMAKYGKTTYVDAWSGRPTTPIGDAICAETVNGLPPAVVVASGTNDIFNPTVMATQINRIKGCIASKNSARTDGIVTKLFWVDVQATRWGQTEYTERNDQRNSMAVNLAIYQNLDKGQIVQWTQRFMSNPALLGTYLVDGVHPNTTTGYPYWAAILRGWLDTLGAI